VPAAERADAARNRAKVLSAARRLVARRGVDQVTMHAVARAAGVGKGTVFHRFGNRAGLIRALLDDAEKELQDALLRGPPPLGPGAPAADRLDAFVGALADFTLAHAELLVAADSGLPGGRYATGAYAAWHQHVAVLAVQLRPEADAAVLAHLVLAPLDPTLVRHLATDRGLDPDRLRVAIRDAARALTAG
jgi:AcrR family transcriptional regulator